MSKPPYSFSCLIFMAVEDSKEKKLPVKVKYILFKIVTLCFTNIVSKLAMDIIMI